VQKQFNLVDTVAVLFGAHFVKLGIDYRKLLPDTRHFRYQQSLLITSLNDLLAQTVTSAGIATNAPVSPRYSNLSLFAGDAWRVPPVSL